MCTKDLLACLIFGAVFLTDGMHIKEFSYLDECSIHPGIYRYFEKIHTVRHIRMTKCTYSANIWWWWWLLASYFLPRVDQSV